MCCTIRSSIFKKLGLFFPVKIDKKLEDVNPKTRPQNVNLSFMVEDLHQKSIMRYLDNRHISKIAAHVSSNQQHNQLKISNATRAEEATNDTFELQRQANDKRNSATMQYWERLRKG